MLMQVTILVQQNVLYNLAAQHGGETWQIILGVAYHLNLIKRILGTDLEAMDEIFSFYLGLCAYDLLRET